MKRITKSLTIAGALASTGVIATNTAAHADSVNNPDTVDQIVQNNTLENSKQELAQAENTVTKNKEHVASLNLAVQQKQQQVKDTQQLADSSTVSNIEKTDSDISSISNKITQTQDNLQSQQQKAQNLEQDIANTQNAISNVQQEIKNQSTAIENAQQKVVEAQSAVNNSSTVQTEEIITNSSANASSIESGIATTKAHQAGLESDLVKYKESYESNKDLASSFQKNVNEAQLDFDNTQKQLSVAEQAVASQNAKVDSAKEKLVIAQKNVNDSSITNAVEKVSNHQANIESVQKDLNEATQKETILRNELEKSKKQLEDYNNNLAEASEALFDANNNLANSEKEAKKSASEVDSALNKLNSAEEALKDIPQFTATDKMKQATLNFIQKQRDYNNGKIRFAEFHEAELEWGKSLKEGIALNQYHTSNAIDKNTKIDLNNLTVEQQTEISNYAATVINLIRHSFNIVDYVGEVRVTTHAMSIAKELSDSYPNYGTYNYGHNSKKLDEITQRYNGTPVHESLGHIVHSDSSVRSMLEFPGEKTDYNLVRTMASLKDHIYTSIVSMICDDARGSYGHAEHILGISEIGVFDRNSLSQRVTSLGVSTVEFTGKVGSMMPNGLIQTINFETFPDVPGLSVYPQSNVVSNTLDIQKLQDEVNNARNVYNNTLTKQKQATQRLELVKTDQLIAESKYNTVTSQVKQATDDLNIANKNYKEVNVTKNSLTEKLSNELVALDDAKKELSMYNALHSEKLLALQNAHSELNNEIVLLQKLTSDLNEKQEISNTSQQKLIEAMDKLNKQSSIVNSEEKRVANIQKSLEEDSKLIQRLENELANELSKLEEAKNALESIAMLNKINTQALEVAKKQFVEETQKLVSLQKKEEQLQTKKQSLNDDLNDVNQNISDTKALLSQLAKQKEELEVYRNQLVNSPKVLNDLLAELKQLEEEYNSALLSYAESQKNVERIQEKLTRFENRLKFEQKLQEQLDSKNDTTSNQSKKRYNSDTPSNVDSTSSVGDDKYQRNNNISLMPTPAVATLPDLNVATNNYANSLPKTTNNVPSNLNVQINSKQLSSETSKTELPQMGEENSFTQLATLLSGIFATLTGSMLVSKNKKSKKH